ncbi:uncharacterized protein DEA37_0000837 [Paragonimus westermani]|uniref:Coiled-coil domain-containing protein 132 n=1 Tax=Paragonimus westermani TaxID=34504 RepID=A0A5J4NNJ3_9TREM|nr:uncharacterized protein DEA37_0000837 [Paragonimus westermani]
MITALIYTQAKMDRVVCDTQLMRKLGYSPRFSRDPHVNQEILRSVEQDYFSMTFDAGKFEIENSAGPTCRELAKLKLRLLLLDKQNKAVSRRVSELVLEKHPLYETELKGVLSLQTDNWETLGICQRIRQSLNLSANVLVLSRLTVLRNFRRRLRLQRTLQVLRQIRSLQNTVHHLESLLRQGDFHAAIELHRESLVLLEDYRQYRCIDPIHVKLKAFGLRIDDLLDTELQKSCEHFSEASYTTVQRAFELLGSTQTTFAQLQMHYVTAIHRRALSILQDHVQPEEDSDPTVTANVPDRGRNYSELSSRLPMHSLPVCLSTLCQQLWLILLCYHQTVDWHRNRACAKRPHKQVENGGSTALPGTQGSPFVFVRAVDDTQAGWGQRPVSRHLDRSDSDEDNGTCHSQLVRQWHDYVAAKLGASRNRIWTEIVACVEPVLIAMGQSATVMSFDQISIVLRTVNRFVKMGEEFSGTLSPDLLEVLRASIHKFFRDFHKKHLDRLRMFLENETWEMCPVKTSFTVMDLHSMQTFQLLLCSVSTGIPLLPRPISNGFESSRLVKQDLFNSVNRFCHLLILELRSVRFSLSCQLLAAQPECAGFFVPPYKTRQFLLDRETECGMMYDPSDSAASVKFNLTDSGSETNCYSANSTSSMGLSKRVNSPLFSNTALEVLRLIGRYMQMMQLLRPIAAEVMHCVCQVFDYYLYSDRYALPAHEPMHVLNSVRQFSVTTADSGRSALSLSTAYLQAHCVGVESVICLADILELSLLPHLSVCLPERKRGLTSVFREQSLMAARQLREACAVQIAPQLFQILMPVSSSPPETSNATATTSTIASSLSKIWPIHTGHGDKENPSTTGPQRGMSNGPAELGFAQTNVLASSVAAIKWTSKDVASVPSPFVKQLHLSVFLPFSNAIQMLKKRLGLCENSKSIIWNALLTYVGSLLLNAFAQIQLCSEEGRSQMLLDVQSIAVMAETESKIRPYPKLDHVIEYIQAFYVPTHEWEHWLTNTGIKYTRSQLTGLAHCIARGDRRQRQRLLNIINQVYNAPGLTATGNAAAGLQQPT